MSFEPGYAVTAANGYWDGLREGFEGRGFARARHFWDLLVAYKAAVGEDRLREELRDACVEIPVGLFACVD